MAPWFQTFIDFLGQFCIYPIFFLVTLVFDPTLPRLSSTHGLMLSMCLTFLSFTFNLASLASVCHIEREL